jgi:short-subunit dehydrogenase
VAATLSSPGEAAYDASKAALSAFSEAMAIDLWDSTVGVLAVYPGLIATELLDAPDNEPVTGGVEAITTDEVASAVLDALAAGDHQCYVPAWFADIAAGKAANVAGFLAGAADFVRQQSAGAASSEAHPS